MEYTNKKCKRKCKRHVNLFHDLFHTSSDSSISLKSKASLRPSLRLPKKSQKKKGSNEVKKRDYLTRLYDKKKLKEKSLSKKMKTPFDRKLDKTCWPIDLKKISKIQKKPHERRKEKPNYKSLSRKKFFNPSFISRIRDCKECSPTFGPKKMDFCGEGLLNRAHQYITKSHFLCEPVTPQMLIDVLKDSEHLKAGATLDTIIKKLRALKADLNPSQDRLKSEVSQKLFCTIKLGLIVEKNGYYRIAEKYNNNKVLSRRKVLAFWELWYRRMTDDED